MSSRKLPIVVLILLCSVALACDDDDSVALVSAPSSFANKADFVAVQPAVVTPSLFPSSACPSQRAFFAPVTLIVGPSVFAITLTEVRLDFIDSRGVRGSPLILDSTAITQRFRDPLVESLSTGTFPLTFGLGCASTTGTLSVSVRTTDSSGMASSSTSTLQVGTRN